MLLAALGCDKQSVSGPLDNVDQVVGVFVQDMYYEQLTDDLTFEIDEHLLSLNQSLVLGNLLKEKSQLAVLRISDQNCSLCVETELEEIEKLQQVLPEHRVVVLASFENKRGLKILTEGLKKIGTPIFSVRFDKVHLPIEEANIPYYFVLNRDWTVSNIFIPKRSFPDLTNTYFSVLAARLSE